MTVPQAGVLSLSCLLAVLVALPARAQPPRIERPVTDLAGALAPADVAGLETRVLELARRHGVQASVLIVTDTGGLPLEDYSLAVAEAWSGGSSDSDRGLLLLLATRQRAMRLELGYGLEEHLPDAVARALLDGAQPDLQGRRWSRALGLVLDGIETRSSALLPDGPLPGARRALGSRLPFSFLSVLGLGALSAFLVRGRSGLLPYAALFGVAPALVALIFRDGVHWWWAQALTWIVGAGTALSLSALRPSHAKIADWMAGGFVSGALLTLFLPLPWQDSARAEDLLLLLALCVGTTLLAPALPWLVRRPHLLHLVLRTLMMAGGATYGRGGRLPSSGDWGGSGGGFGGGGAGKRW